MPPSPRRRYCRSLYIFDVCVPCSRKHTRTHTRTISARSINLRQSPRDGIRHADLTRRMCKFSLWFHIDVINVCKIELKIGNTKSKWYFRKRPSRLPAFVGGVFQCILSYRTIDSNGLCLWYIIHAIVDNQKQSSYINIIINFKFNIVWISLFRWFNSFFVYFYILPSF